MCVVCTCAHVRVCMCVSEIPLRSHFKVSQGFNMLWRVNKHVLPNTTNYSLSLFHFISCCSVCFVLFCCFLNGIRPVLTPHKLYKYLIVISLDSRGIASLLFHHWPFA